MTPLQAFLDATGESADDFARRTGADAGLLARVAAGEAAPDPKLARLIVEASAGELGFEDVYLNIDPDGAELIDISDRIDRRIDAPNMYKAAAITLRQVFADDPDRANDDLVIAVVRAVELTLATLAKISSRQGSDRLVQALHPILAETLAENDRPLSERQLSQTVRTLLEIYELTQMRAPGRQTPPWDRD